MSESKGKFQINRFTFELKWLKVIVARGEVHLRVDPTLRTEDALILLAPEWEELVSLVEKCWDLLGAKSTEEAK